MKHGDGRKLLLALLAMVFAAAGAAGSAGRNEVCDYKGNLPVTMITQQDAGKSVTLGLGETVTISLDENPSTGFRWELEPGTDPTLELLSSEYLAAPSARVGAGGRHLWTFKARKSGEVRLVLTRRRPWEKGEKDDSGGEHFDVTIDVKN